jgi:hypothetical protein
MVLGSAGASALAVDPANPTRVFAGANNRIYKSIDSGATWTEAYYRASMWPTNITIAPSNSLVLYVGQLNSFLFRSTDGGTNWSVLETVKVSGVAIHPTDYNTVYAAAATCDSYGGLLTSTDGFAHFATKQVSSLPDRPCVSAVALEPSMPSTVYVGTTRGVFRSMDSGDTWHPFGLDNRWVTVLVVDPATPGRLYAGTNYGGVFVRDWAMEGVPSADGITPASGSTAGGQTVTIWGGNFVPFETAVTFNGVPATSVLVEPSGLSLTAVTPAGAAGPAEIIVTTLRGSSTPLTGFTYSAPAPTVSSVVPTGGSVAGGTTVTVTGTDFGAGQTTVTVGGVAATGVNVSGTTSLTAVTPAHVPGAVDLVVTTPGGSATLANGYTYVGALSPFTDDPLTATGTVVKAVHITELRQRVDQLRARYALSPFGWTDATLVQGGTPVRAVHVAELRTALNGVYAASGRTAPTYTQATLTGGSTVVRAADVAELRAAVVSVW